jgi:predicted dehydrogenase
MPFSPMVNPRIALIGCGTVGEIHRERLIEAGVEIVALCDPNSEALAGLASRLPHRPKLFRADEDLLSAGIADAVVLCTPHGLHGAQIAAALQAGVHVLCEKPLVTKAAEARRLIAQANEKNLILFVAYTRRGRGHANFLLQAAERIRPLNTILITRAQPWFQTYGWNWRMHEDEGGGFLLDAGASMLDLLLHLTGTATTHREVQLFRRSGSEVDVRASVRLDFIGGMRGEMTLIGDATEHLEQILIFGENGMAGWYRYENGPQMLYIHPEGEEHENHQPADYRVATPDQAFLAALRSGGDPNTPDFARYDAVSALPAIELVESLYQAAYWR